ncbi:MAG TPA: DUF2336 domain-containing protein [Pseudolabrys sp.]|nr:DUF2336 domain-containing protein [Pseudolabrys sp.]
MTEYPAFPRIEGLLDLERRNGVDVRPTLLRVLTDLYVQARSHTPDEEAQYVELAMRLIDSVDETTRSAIAARLIAYPRAPQAVLARLGEIGVTPEVASPPLAPRQPDIRNAFFAATSYERQMILTNLDAGDPANEPPAAAPETCKRLEAAVLEGNISEFTRILEGALVVSRNIAIKIVADPLGEPLVIAAKALGMPRDALQRILLLLNPAIGQSVPRVYELAALFDEINMATADSMIAIWRGRAPPQQKPAAPAYQPATYDDEQVSARAASTPQRHQNTSRRSDSLANRFRNLGR